MPATRSRTENWRNSLDQIASRGGSLEISIATNQPDPVEAQESHSGDVVWRVKLLGVREDEIVVEHPGMLGQSIPLREGLELICVMTLGQNRWMFRTSSKGAGDCRAIDSAPKALRLAIPEKVERCSRRSFYRVPAANLRLPTVQVRELLDASSATPAEIAVRERIEALESGTLAGSLVNPDDPLLLPEVGPSFHSKLVNIGGGGVGLMIEHDESGGVESARRFWLQIDLTPYILAPLGVCAKLAHTKMDSQQRVYAGLSFDFDHNPQYRNFIVDTIAAYAHRVQEDQLKTRQKDQRA
ncbi:MAG: PilZ domain-containing protein [Planctomycetota bacterium]